MYLYQRAATAPTAPTGTFTYTFSSGLLTGGALGSWSQTNPSTNGNSLWVIVATASSNTASDTIAATEFSAPIILAQDGASITGAPASSAYLTKESQNLFAYADGTVVSFSNANGFFRIFSGTSDVTASATGFSATASGCTGTINTSANNPINGQPAGYYQVTAMSADNATLTLSATYAGSTFTKVFTLTKARGGYEIVATLPTTNNFEGRVVFLTSDDKLYRFNGTAFTSAVPAVDISGTITETQIATDAITAPKIKAGEITSAKLYSGAVEADRIQANNISAGSITTAKLASTQISAMFATIGTLRTATTGGRVEISDNVIKVYDASSTSATTGLRVKIGNLTL